MCPEILICIIIAFCQCSLPSLPLITQPFPYIVLSYESKTDVLMSLFALNCL